MLMTGNIIYLTLQNRPVQGHRSLCGMVLLTLLYCAIKLWWAFSNYPKNHSTQRCLTFEETYIPMKMIEL